MLPKIARPIKCWLLVALAVLAIGCQGPPANTPAGRAPGEMAPQVAARIGASPAS
jgi:hypothetical protein